MSKKSRKLDTQEDEGESFQNFDPKSREKRRNRRKMKNKFDNAVRQSKYVNSTRSDEEFLLDEDLSSFSDDEY